MNDIPLSILFGALAALLLLSAFFSSSETALMTLNRYRLQHLIKQGHKSAKKAQRLLKRPDRLLGLILLGNNFVNILASSLATVIGLRLMGDEGIAVAAGILTLVVLIFSEVAPKTLAALKPELIAFPASWVYTPLLKLFYPIVWFVNLIANGLLRIFGIKASEHNHTTLNKDELKSIVSETDSIMPDKYKNILLGIIDLENATVEDIMTPRNEIVGINIEDPTEEIIQQLKNSPHTRIPVYKESIDRVIGFLHLRTIMTQLFNSENFTKQDITNNLITPVFIPETTPLHKQIQSFKVDKMRIGLAVDEYGDVQGLVSMDDLLQGIVGEIMTEEADVKTYADGSYLIDGSVTIRELNRITHWNLPTEGPKTINGLIIEFMETIPQEGTNLIMHDQHLEIISRNKHAITQVKFLPIK
ncbi:MAG: HlyC/CorC family transporter [Gammaproteobacteria bacterium]|nr:HlyC/CorC family transporter [Gammaproteobacteria bacterium]MBT5222006.1 HlyC/CorC family transporter [Gammaproteobacteria bacterium]MBT5825828.1 HlyC/CorC family transporter [Gammaproteobacteria bacterium]MBT5966793.1 HlyC/CorC family transporter [Gammaproteobacteria bacterium]MBT6418820.1 HlyC/CorC family transporter [Gammaproteobacteria bacterium]